MIKLAIESNTARQQPNTRVCDIAAFMGKFAKFWQNDLFKVPVFIYIWAQGPAFLFGFAAYEPHVHYVPMGRVSYA